MIKQGKRNTQSRFRNCTTINSNKLMGRTKSNRRDYKISQVVCTKTVSKAEVTYNGEDGRYSLIYRRKEIGDNRNTNPILFVYGLKKHFHTYTK